MANRTYRNWFVSDLKIAIEIPPEVTSVARNGAIGSTRPAFRSALFELPYSPNINGLWGRFLQVNSAIGRW